MASFDQLPDHGLYPAAIRQGQAGQPDANALGMPTRRFFEHPPARETVRADAPTMALNASTEPLLFDDYLVKKPAGTVPVKEDSMIEAGIFEGDLAVVERASSAKLGSFVVACVEDQFTLTELVKVDGEHALTARNRRYLLIRLESAWSIFGVMVGLN